MIQTAAEQRRLSRDLSATVSRSNVPPITDAEYAFGASTTGEGLWLPVLEQAYGRLKMADGFRRSPVRILHRRHYPRWHVEKRDRSLHRSRDPTPIVLRSVKHTKIPATRPNEEDNDQANHTADLDAAERNRADLAMPSNSTVEKLRAALKDAVTRRII